jgi:tetratricopeptide (TPR) repeat protein
MKCSPMRSLMRLFLFLGLMSACISAPAQKVPQQSPSKPINLDRELEEQVNPDRAVSYYHYSLAKWNEDKGDLPKAVSEMRSALKYHPDSPAIYLEMAGLMAKSGSPQEAIEYAQKAAELDPKDPGPHWLLANIYFRPQMRGDSATADIQKAAKELEKLRELSPSDERVYYALGGAYFELNQPEKAIEAYEKFQSLSPDIDNGYREIAKYYDRIGNSEKAIEYLLLGLKNQPESVESLTMLAGIYLKQSKNKEAIPIYKKLLAVTGENTGANRRLASLLIEAGENSEAINILNDLAKTAPGDPMCQILLGRAQIGLHKYPEAIEILKSVSTNDLSISTEAQFYLGRAYEESGNRKEAIEIFSRLLQRTPADDEESKTNRMLFQQRLAANYWEEGEREKAIAVYQDMAKADPKANALLLQAYRINHQFDKALPLGKEQFEKDPSNLQTGIEYAQALTDAGKTKEGAEILNRLLQSNPEEVDLYIALSQLYMQDKRFSDAEKILQRAEEKNPKDGSDKDRIKFQKATVYERQKDYDRAESLFKELLKNNPSNAMVLNYLGYMLADRGVRLDEALKYVKEALVIDPRNGAYLDSLGWAYFKLNDLQNAETYLLEAEQIVKNDATIVEHLGDLYYKTGDLQKAESYWGRSVSIGTDPDDTQKVRKKLETLQEKLRRQKSAK